MIYQRQYRRFRKEKQARNFSAKGAGGVPGRIIRVHGGISWGGAGDPIHHFARDLLFAENARKSEENDPKI